jgi:hypothetical protein
MRLEGIVQNGVIVLNNGGTLPEGTPVEVTVKGEVKTAEAEAEKEPTLAYLRKYSGCMPDLPADFAAQHDHYLHGTPKK